MNTACGLAGRGPRAVDWKRGHGAMSSAPSVLVQFTPALGTPGTGMVADARGFGVSRKRGSLRVHTLTPVDIGGYSRLVTPCGRSLLLDPPPTRPPHSCLGTRAKVGRSGLNRFSSAISSTLASQR